MHRCKPDPKTDLILFMLFRVDRKLSRLLARSGDGSDAAKIKEISDAIEAQKAEIQAALTRNTIPGE